MSAPASERAVAPSPLTAGPESENGGRPGVRALAPLLLVHGGAPWQANGRAVLLDAGAQNAGRPCIHVAISLEGRPLEVPPEFPRPVVQIIGRGGIRGMGLLDRIAPWTARQLFWTALYPALLARRAASSAKDLVAHRPHAMAIFLNAVEVPAVAAALRRAIGVPYSTMEWDLLDEGFDALGLAPAAHRRVIHSLAALRAGAVRRGVASEGMEAFYRRQWGLDALVLRQPATSRKTAQTHDPRGPFVIALCGNVYAVEEFRCLVDALTRLEWSAVGRPIELRVIGALGPDVGPVPKSVRVTGWVSYEESLAFLGDADLGYCPYWFDPARARVVSTSFPSKLISYLTCGVPVLYHGPEIGTPAAFLAKYPAGFNCHSLDPAMVAETIVGLVRAPERLAAARVAAASAVAYEFSLPTLRHRLTSWLATEETE